MQCKCLRPWNPAHENNKTMVLYFPSWENNSEKVPDIIIVKHFVFFDAFYGLLLSHRQSYHISHFFNMPLPYLYEFIFHIIARMRVSLVKDNASTDGSSHWEIWCIWFQRCIRVLKFPTQFQTCDLGKFFSSADFLCLSVFCYHFLLSFCFTMYSEKSSSVEKKIVLKR